MGPLHYFSAGFVQWSHCPSFHCSAQNSELVVQHVQDDRRKGSGFFFKKASMLLHKFTNSLGREYQEAAFTYLQSVRNSYMAPLDALNDARSLSFWGGVSAGPPGVSPSSHVATDLGPVL